MKKVYVFGVASFLALSLLLAGCGRASNTETTQPDKQSTKQSQDMNNMNNMDHSKMNMNGNK
ncbi:MAG: hypothetical protein ACYC0Q_06475 [Eubacteriales bacterium]